MKLRCENIVGLIIIVYAVLGNYSVNLFANNRFSDTCVWIEFTVRANVCHCHITSDAKSIYERAKELHFNPIIFKLSSFIMTLLKHPERQTRSCPLCAKRLCGNGLNMPLAGNGNSVSQRCENATNFMCTPFSKTKRVQTLVENALHEHCALFLGVVRGGSWYWRSA